MIIEVQLIRHGKTKGNLEKRFLGGRTDEPLCEEGISEIKKYSEENIYEDTDLVFSSPLKRCRETAEIIWPQNKIFIIEEFKEIDFGFFENKTHLQLNGNRQYQEWIDANGMKDVPGGEKLKDFNDRILKGFYKMISLTKGNKISAVVHGGTIMAILSTITKKNYYDFICSNGHGYIFNFSTEENKITDLRKI